MLLAEVWIGSEVNFMARISLAPMKAKMDFTTIMDEVAQHFSSKFGVNIQINIEIQAECKDGFDQGLQRIITENYNVLKFGSTEFED